MRIRTIVSAVLVTLVTGSLGIPALGADALPRRALARLGSHRFYHWPGVECAVLSPDGRRVASAARVPSYFRHVSDRDRDRYERTIILWDAATGERIRELLAPRGPVVRLTFSPDGTRLAAACGPFVVMFEMETGKFLLQLGKFERSADSLRFSADGKQLCVGEYEGPVTSWDVETGKRLRRWRSPAAPSDWVKADERVTEAVLSPDGKFIAWRLWRLPDYSKLPPGVVLSAAVPRPTVLVVTEATTDRPLHRQVFEEGSLDAFAFSRDGRRFVIGGDKLSVRDTASGKEVFTLNAPAYRCALSPDGRRAVVAESNSRVQLWDLQTRKPSHVLCPGLVYINSDTLEEPRVFSADGETLVLATDTTLRLFDTTTGRERGAAGHRTPITPRFSADGRTLFTTCNETRCSWDLSGREPIRLTHKPRNAWEGICGDQALAHSADGLLVVARRGDRVCVCETITGRVVCGLDGVGSPYFALFSPDASRVLLGHSEQASLHAVRTGEKSGEIKFVDRAGYPVFPPDGRFVAWADGAHAVHLNDAVTGKAVRTLRSPRPLSEVECYDAHLLFSPDGEYLIVTSYFSPDRDPLYAKQLPTRVFRVSSGREISRFYANPEKVSRAGLLSCAACSPDGRLLAVAEEESGTIRLIEIVSGKVREELTGHRHGVRGLAFSPDGKMLASGGEDNVVFLWDVIGARASTPHRPPR